ncbi:MAG: hypothetical protein ACE5F1_17570 [Planctomycetota bacterium]
MTKRIFPILVLAAIFPGTHLSAQRSRHVPEFFDRNEGNDSSLRPFAADAFRMQMLIDGGELASRVAVLNEFAFRRDGRNGATPFSGRVLRNLAVTIGLASSTPGTMSQTFAKNRNGTQTVVHSGTYRLPDQPAIKSTGPFNVVFKLAKPFLYFRRRGDLLIEMTIPGKNASKFPYPLDAVSAGPGNARVQEFGGAGLIAQEPGYRVTNDAPTRLQPGGSVVLRASGLTKDRPALGVWGISNTSFGPFKLPLDLLPLGAAGNFLHVSMDLMLPLSLGQDVNTKLFSGSVELRIPPLAAFAGATVYGQVIFADPPTNSLGLVFSNGVRMQISTSPISPLQLLYSDDASSATGFFTLTANGGLGGLVTRFGGPVFD